MVRRLVETTDTRTRLFDAFGRLMADSRVLIGPGGVVQIEELPPPIQGGWLTRLAIDLYDEIVNALPSRDKFPVFREGPVQVANHYEDVVRALTGELSASVWTTPDHGMILTVAVPVQRYKQVLGAVMLSRGGAQIDAAIRSVRLDILKVFAVALAVTVLLSFYLAGTIARPIRKLAAAADHVRRGHGRHHEIPDFSRRGDEIGDLSGALRDMTAALWLRMDAIESFAADVAHEIKNPLTSLRSAVETVARVRDPDQQRRLMSIIEDDIQRMDRLISDISNASRLDAELSRAESEPVDIGRMLRMLTDIHETTAAERAAPRVLLDLPTWGRPDRAGPGRTAGPGLPEHHRQRAVVLPAGRDGRRPRQGHRRQRRSDRDRRGAGHAGRQAGSDLRPLLHRAAGRREVRHPFRAGAQHLQTDRRCPWRRDLRPQPSRGWRDWRRKSARRGLHRAPAPPP